MTIWTISLCYCKFMSPKFRLKALHHTARLPTSFMTQPSGRVSFMILLPIYSPRVHLCRADSR